MGAGVAVGRGVGNVPGATVGNGVGNTTGVAVGKGVGHVIAVGVGGNSTGSLWQPMETTVSAMKINTNFMIRQPLATLRCVY